MTSKSFSTRLFMVILLTSPNKKVLFQSASILSCLLKFAGKSYQCKTVPVRRTVTTLLNSPHVNRTSQKQFFSSPHKITFAFFFNKKESFFNYLLFLFLTNVGMVFSVRLFS